jgi:hypothetical protein
MRMSGIDVVRSVGPLIGMQTLLGAESHQGRFGWGR